MSTIVVVRKGGVAAIGADTLTKHGYTKQSATMIVNHSKMVKVGRSWVAVTGEASWTQVLHHFASRLETPPLLDTPEDVFEFANGLHGALKEDYFLQPPDAEKEEFESTGLDCLIANPSGIFGLYALRSVDEFTSYYAFGSGAPFALGAMHACYAKTRSARDVARIGLEAAAAFDDATGEPLELHTIRLG